MRLCSGNQLLTGLLLALLVSLLLCLWIGPVSLDWNAVTTSSVSQNILLNLRIPRVLLAALVGALLSLCGGVLQGMFRNPLADPALIGVSAGASVGASLVIWLAGTGLMGSLVWSQWSGLSLISLGAFVGGMLAVFMVYLLATDARRGTSVLTMLLVGVAISALAGAVNTVLILLVDNEMLRRMSLWQMGMLDLANYPRVIIAAGVLGLCLVLLFRQSQSLNALLLGEAEAGHLGVNVERTKRSLILLCALGVGVATAVAGAIGFVGLVVPHWVRLLIGPDHRYLLPCSTVLGALLLVWSDAFARTVLAPAEIPVGVITAVIGVPFFLSLLIRQRGYDGAR